jgi:hypothetical protein
MNLPGSYISVNLAASAFQGNSQSKAARNRPNTYGSIQSIEDLEQTASKMEIISKHLYKTGLAKKNQLNFNQLKLSKASNVSARWKKHSSSRKRDTHRGEEDLLVEDRVTTLNSKNVENQIQKKVKISKDKRELYLNTILEFYGQHKRLSKAKSFHKLKILEYKLEEKLVQSMRNPEILQFMAQNQDEIYRKIRQQYTEVKEKDPADKLTKINILTMVDGAVKILGKKQVKVDHDKKYRYPNNVVMVDRNPHKEREFDINGKVRETHNHENLDLMSKDIRMRMKKEEIRKRLESKNISTVQTQPVEINYISSIKRALQKSLSVGMGKEERRNFSEIGGGDAVALTSNFGDSELNTFAETTHSQIKTLNRHNGEDTSPIYFTEAKNHPRTFSAIVKGPIIKNSA